jgi:hypothetical protein
MGAEVRSSTALRVALTDDALIVELSDGRTISVPPRMVSPPNARHAR